MSAKHIVRHRFPARRICALVMVTALFAAVDGQVAGASLIANAISSGRKAAERINKFLAEL